MPLMTGPYAVALVLLLLAGAFKVWQPQPTTNAMSALGLPAGAALSRLLGITEVAVAMGALLLGVSWFSLAAAALYLGFTIFVIGALRRGLAIQSCGCFGKTDTPPSIAHVIVNLVAAALLTHMAVIDPGSLFMELVGDVPVAIGVAIATYLTYVVLTVLPAALAEVANPA